MTHTHTPRASLPLDEDRPPPDGGEPQGSRDPDRPAMLGKRFRQTIAGGMLVGLALAVFFLLLIALSEHIAFGLAYAFATTGCVALLAAYLSAALHGWRRGAGFAGMIAALYAALYGLLVSEDNALLLGALLVFCLLAAAMLLTRKVDWYAVRTPLTSA